MPTVTAPGATPGQVDSLITALEAMLSTLEEEHLALSAADALALEDIAGRKALTVEKISRLYEDLKQDLGLNSNASAQDSPTAAFTAALNGIRTSTPQLAERLDQLVVLTRACRQSNLNNGTLVNLGLHNCQANLNLLQGLSQTSQPGTYGSHAQPEDSFASLQRLQLRA